MSSVFDWLFALGIILGFSFGLTYITKGGMKTFFIFFCIFSGFMVYSGSLPLSFLVVNLILISLVWYLIIKNSFGG